MTEEDKRAAAEAAKQIAQKASRARARASPPAFVPPPREIPPEVLTSASQALIDEVREVLASVVTSGGAPAYELKRERTRLVVSTAGYSIVFVIKKRGLLGLGAEHTFSGPLKMIEGLEYSVKVGRWVPSGRGEVDSHLAAKIAIEAMGKVLRRLQREEGRQVAHGHPPPARHHDQGPSPFTRKKGEG